MGRDSQRTCVRNACTNVNCQCRRCTPRPFNPSRNPAEERIEACTCTLSDKPEHELVGIEEVWEKSGLKYRWVCSCGEKGIPVGCAVLQGEEWARGAFRHHVSKINYDLPRGTP